MTEYNVVQSPLTDEEMKARADEDNYIAGVVKVTLMEIINNDLEGFLDIIPEKLTGSCCLMDVSYEIVGAAPGKDAILIKVTGDISEVV